MILKKIYKEIIIQEPVQFSALRNLQYKYQSCQKLFTVDIMPKLKSPSNEPANFLVARKQNKNIFVD